MGTVAATVLAMMVTVTPSNGGLLSPPQIAINNGAGSQFDPHVDQDIAAYSNVLDNGVVTTQEIRYYHFPTNKDLAIPNELPGGIFADDLLSDVDQGRIVFTRLFPDRSAIMLFDSATMNITELAPAPASRRIGVAIGGQTVAFVDYADGDGEVKVLDLATSAVTVLTNNAISDANPAVSPDGNVVVWESCPSSNCDIYRAIRAGGSWSVSAMTSTVLTDNSPDTNGAQIVFQRQDAAGSNLVLVPVGGGAETVLEIAGDQYNPSIRGQLVAFESRGVGALNSDIYVVDLVNNRLFQITNTPDFSESLNDVTWLPSGEVRLVWQANDEADVLKGNIYGTTFTLPVVLPPPPVCRSVTLEATRFHSPTRSVDGNASFNPPLRFAIPGSLPVVAGNAGNKKANLTIDLGARTVECEYRSRSTQSHPSSPAQLALASSYVLNRCRVHHGCNGRDDEDEEDDDDSSSSSYTSGSLVTAVSVRLHIQNGDTHQPLTRVRVVLAEVCGTSTVSSPLDADNSIDGPQAAGCSSAGGSLTPFLFAFAFLALMLRRSPSIRLVTEQEQRKLPR